MTSKLARLASGALLIFIFIGFVGSTATADVTAATSDVTSASDTTATTTATTNKTNQSFLQNFPNLKQYVFKPPQSGFYLGTGFSPVGVATNRFIFSADFFQVHYISNKWDFEILNASYGFTMAQSSEFQSTDFTFRTSPKYRLNKTFSVGPIVGYEFVSFPKVGSHIVSPSTNLETNDQPFSSNGIIYGAMVSETYPYKKNYLIQFNEMAYQETYSTTHTAQNWIYLFDDSSISANHNLIGAELVYMVGLSFLY